MSDKKSKWIEFKCPNFGESNHADAKYRRSVETVELINAPTFLSMAGTITSEVLLTKLPSKLEVMTRDGWQQHAVVFRWLSNLCYISDDGRWASSTTIDERFYEEAEKLGLTKGRIGTDLPTPREYD